MEVAFGSYQFKIKEEEQKQYIFDIVRKKWILLTSEEKVRQLWIHLLVELGYSTALIQIEKGFLINDRKKRIDICVFDNQLQPILLIECKAPDISISKESVLEQILNYNLHYQVDKFIITNGNDSIGFKLVEGKVEEIKNILELKTNPN
jgi:Type I restriction enzyme R protein N terminus (HSDR_N)